MTGPNLALNNGYTIPQLGFGVFKIVPGETAAAVREALRVGYRHIDTAEMYRNEKEVGEALRTSGLDRSEVFITSKLNNGFHRPDAARQSLRWHPRGIRFGLRRSVLDPLAAADFVRR